MIKSITTALVLFFKLVIDFQVRQAKKKEKMLHEDIDNNTASFLDKRGWVCNEGSETLPSDTNKDIPQNDRK